MSAYKRVLKFITEKQAEYAKCLSKNIDEGHKRAIQIEYASMISGMLEVALAIEDWVGLQYIVVSDEWYDPKLDED